MEKLQEIRRHQWLGLIGISSTVVIVVSSIAGLLINELLDLRVRDRIEATIEQELSETRYQMELARLTLSVTDLRQRLSFGSVAKEDLDQIKEELTSFLNTYIFVPQDSGTSLHDRERRISSTIAELIDIAASTGSDQYVEEFYSLAPEIVSNNDSVTQTMTQHTGRRLIGDPGAPEAWRSTDDKPTAEYSNFKRFSERALDTGYPELYLAFHLVARHMEGAPHSEIEALIDDAKTLNDIDKKHFVRLMVAHSTGRYANAHNASVGRVASRFSRFLEEFSDSLDWIESVELGLSEMVNG